MTIEQWLFHYKMIQKKKSEEAMIKRETIKAVVEESINVLSTLFERNAETIGYFVDRKAFFDYMDRKRDLKKDQEPETDSEELTEDEKLERDFELFMSDAFPDNVELETKLIAPEKPKLKKQKRMVGIQQRINQGGPS